MLGVVEKHMHSFSTRQPLPVASSQADLLADVCWNIQTGLSFEGVGQDGALVQELVQATIAAPTCSAAAPCASTMPGSQRESLDQTLATSRLHSASPH